MTRKDFIIRGPQEREQIIELARSVKDGWRVEFKAPKRSDEQSAKMWAMLNEVSKQARHHTLQLEPGDWKLIFLNALRRETRMVPNLDGNGLVSLERSSSDLTIAEMRDLIELIHAYGAQNGVVFREPRPEAN